MKRQRKMFSPRAHFFSKHLFHNEARWRQLPHFPDRPASMTELCVGFERKVYAHLDMANDNDKECEAQ